MVPEIRKLGDAVLRENCREVREVDHEIKNLFLRMDETLHAHPGRVGLAANQVGILKKLFIYDMGFGTRCFLNPQIIEKEGEEIREEGCLSIPGITVPVPRATRVKVRFESLDGYRLILEAYGFTARVIQHECDHLEGVLILDRCDPAEKRRALAKYEELQIKGQVVNV